MKAAAKTSFHGRGHRHAAPDTRLQVSAQPQSQRTRHARTPPPKRQLEPDAIGVGRRESYIHEYLNLRYGVRLELLDVLVEQQGPRAVLLVALEAWSGPYFHTELEERAPLVQRDARRRGRLEEL